MSILCLSCAATPGTGAGGQTSYTRPFGSRGSSKSKKQKLESSMHAIAILRKQEKLGVKHEYRPWSCAPSTLNPSLNPTSSACHCHSFRCLASRARRYTSLRALLPRCGVVVLWCCRAVVLSAHTLWHHSLPLAEQARTSGFLSRERTTSMLLSHFLLSHTSFCPYPVPASVHAFSALDMPRYSSRYF